MQETFLDKLGLGLTTTAIGLFVVFLGLIILIGMIYVLTSITKREKKAAAPAPAPVPAAPAEAEAAEEEAEESDESVIAAITAAIACVWQDENQGFVVRRVRRVAAPSWQRAAREEQILTRM